MANLEREVIKANVKDADAVDKAIGEKITLLRTIMGITRQELAEKIGITHQQLHKYEKAINRVSVGRLVAIAIALSVDVSYFFEDLTKDIPQEEIKRQRACMELMRDFINIDDEDHKDAIKALIRALAQSNS